MIKKQHIANPQRKHHSTKSLERKNETHAHYDTYDLEQSIIYKLVSQCFDVTDSVVHMWEKLFIKLYFYGTLYNYGQSIWCGKKIISVKNT